MSNKVISHEQVLHDVYTFLAHYEYTHALLALQIESGVAYNVINTADGSIAHMRTSRFSSSVSSQQLGNASNTNQKASPLSSSAFERCILDGRYDELLTVYLANTLLPYEVKRNLYELMVEEMLYVHGLLPAARALFQHGPVFAIMKSALPARYTRLEQMINTFDIAKWEYARERNAHINVNEIQRKREALLAQLLQCIKFESNAYNGRLEAALSIVYGIPQTMYKETATSVKQDENLWEEEEEEEEQEEQKKENVETENKIETSMAKNANSHKRQRVHEDHCPDSNNSDDNNKRKSSSHSSGDCIQETIVNNKLANLSDVTASVLPYSTSVPNNIYRKLLYETDKTVSCCICIKRNTERNSTEHHDNTNHLPEHTPQVSNLELQKHSCNMTSEECHVALNQTNSSETQQTSQVMLTGKVDGVTDFVELSSFHTVGNAVGHTSGVLCMCTDTANTFTTTTPNNSNNINDTVNNNTLTDAMKVSNECQNVTGNIEKINTWVAIGYRDGCVKVYNTLSHRLIRRFERVHSLGVTNVTFIGSSYMTVTAATKSAMTSASKQAVLLSGHRTSILSASFDSSIAVLDILTSSILYKLTDAHHGASIHSLCNLTLPLIRHTLLHHDQAMETCVYTSMQNSNATDDAYQQDYEETMNGNITRSRDVVWPFLSSGDDGLLNVWHYSAKIGARGQQQQQHLTRLSPSIPLQSIYGELQNDAPSLVHVIVEETEYSLHDDWHRTGACDLASEMNNTHQKVELVILTRSSTALLVQVEVTAAAAAAVYNSMTATQDHAPPLTWTVLAILNAPKPTRFVTTLITHPVSLRVPMLSIYISLNEGTVCLYNVKMTWRDKEEWNKFGGTYKLSEPLDASSIIVADYGAAISDLHLLVTLYKCEYALTATPLLIAYSPTLRSVYLLRES